MLDYYSKQAFHLLKKMEPFITFLGIKKPLQDSNFSYDQISAIVDRYWIFKRTPNGNRPLEPPDSTYENTIKPTYLPGSEEAWVMRDMPTTEFGQMLLQDTDLIQNLQMSFRPTLLHLKMLEVSDITSVMLRYMHWLNLGIDPSDPKLVSVKILDPCIRPNFGGHNTVTALTHDFMMSAVHVFLFVVQHRWQCVLIDRHSHTFEYFNPQSDGDSIMRSEEGHGIFVRRLLKESRSMDTQLTTRSTQSIGFKKRTIDDMCGVSVLLFVHARLVNHRAFDKALNVPKLTCAVAQEMFYSGDAVCNALKYDAIRHTIPYGNVDVRLATISLGRLLKSTTPNKREDVLAWGQTKELSYRQIVAKIHSLEVEGFADVLLEIQKDPLTVYFRTTKPSPAVRRRMLTNIYREITERHQTNRAMIKFITCLLEEVYIPVLNAVSKSKNIDPSILATTFLTIATKSVSSISFGVHFVREIDKWVAMNMHQPRNSTLTQQFIQTTSPIVRRISLDTVDQITETMTTCHRTMKVARKLLQRIDKCPLVVQEIIDKNVDDLTTHQFLTEGVQPWNFPTDLSCLETTTLLRHDKFKLHYAVGIHIVKYSIQNKLLRTVDVKKVVNSVLHFMSSTTVQSLEHQIFCRLAQILRQVLRPEHDELADKLSCTFTSTVTVEQFFRNVTQKYSQLFHRQ